jgi:hypothetical protein
MVFGAETCALAAVPNETASMALDARSAVFPISTSSP